MFVLFKTSYLYIIIFYSGWLGFSAKPAPESTNDKKKQKLDPATALPMR